MDNRQAQRLAQIEHIQSILSRYKDERGRYYKREAFFTLLWGKIDAECEREADYIKRHFVSDCHVKIKAASDRLQAVKTKRTKDKYSKRIKDEQMHLSFYNERIDALKRARREIRSQIAMIHDGVYKDLEVPADKARISYLASIEADRIIQSFERDMTADMMALDVEAAAGNALAKDCKKVSGLIQSILRGLECSIGGKKKDAAH